MERWLRCLDLLKEPERVERLRLALALATLLALECGFWSTG